MKKIQKIFAVFLSSLIIFLFPLQVFADNVHNDVVVGGNDTINVGGSTTINYRIQATGPGGPACDAADGSSATVTINVPVNVSSTQSSLVFSSCGTDKSTDFSATVAGDYEITVSVTDSSGSYNTNPAKFTLHVTAAPDSTAPVTTDDSDGVWQNNDVTVNFTCTDAESGCANTYFTTDGSTPTTSSTSGSSVTLSDEGVYTIKYFSVDNDGNTEAVQTAVNPVRIDKTNPVIAGLAIPAANSNGWNNTDVTVGFTCTDALSGVDTDSVAGDILTTEGAGQSVTNTGACIDKAGNVADSATVSGINIDKTAPDVTITTPADGAHFVFHANVLADWSASDSLSGIDSATGDVPSGSAIDTNSVGLHSFTVSATDLAGNTTTEIIHYTVDPYTFIGPLAPLTIDSKTFKQNSTIPVKLQLTDGNGTFITNAIATLKVDGVNAVSGGGSNVGNLFRYDFSANQYIFNLSTKMPVLTKGTHTLTVHLDDGTNHTIIIIIK